MDISHLPLRMSRVALETQTHIIGSRLHYYTEIDSTNTKINQLAEDKAPEGTVVISDYQASGRGRQKRKWESPPNRNLLFSFILRPPSEIESIHQITTIAAVSCCETLRKTTGLHVTIKWPNDLQIGKKKLGGILTELKTRENKIDFIIVGIGINVNMRKEDFSKKIQDIATSLEIELKKPVDRENLLIQLLTQLDKYYIQTIKDGIEPMIEIWKELSDMPGQLITVTENKRQVEGYVTNIDTDGGLLIRLKNGTTEKFLSGDITNRN